MTPKMVAEQLEASFTTIKLELPGGRVLVPDRPVSLHEAVQRAAGASDEDCLCELLDDLLLHPLVTLDWGPSFNVLDLGTPRAYICFGPFGHEDIVAAFEPRESVAALTAFLRTIVGGNGADYGINLLDDALVQGGPWWQEMIADKWRSRDLRHLISETEIADIQESWVDHLMAAPAGRDREPSRR